MKHTNKTATGLIYKTRWYIDELYLSDSQTQILVSPYHYESNIFFYILLECFDGLATQNL